METAKLFTTIGQIWEHLDGLGFFHMDLSLTRMETALARLGLSRPPFVVAQIVGTNGKGSTSAFLDSLSRAHGCRTGLYTSPHFLSARACSWPSWKPGWAAPTTPPRPWPAT